MRIGPDVEGQFDDVPINEIMRLDACAVPTPATHSVHFLPFHRQQDFVCSSITRNDLELGADKSVQNAWDNAERGSRVGGADDKFLFQHRSARRELDMA